MDRESLTYQLGRLSAAVEMLGAEVVKLARDDDDTNVRLVAIYKVVAESAAGVADAAEKAGEK